VCAARDMLPVEFFVTLTLTSLYSRVAKPLAEHVFSHVSVLLLRVWYYFSSTTSLSSAEKFWALALDSPINLHVRPQSGIKQYSFYEFFEHFPLCFALISGVSKV
jgi:hypothetical protein